MTKLSILLSNIRAAHLGNIAFAWNVIVFFVSAKNIRATNNLISLQREWSNEYSCEKEPNWVKNIFLLNLLLLEKLDFPTIVLCESVCRVGNTRQQISFVAGATKIRYWKSNIFSIILVEIGMLDWSRQLSKTASIHLSLLPPQQYDVSSTVKYRNKQLNDRIDSYVHKAISKFLNISTYLRIQSE